MQDSLPVKRLGRRTVLKLLGGMGALGTGALFGLSPALGNPYYVGPTSDHFDGRRFFNPDGPSTKPFRDFLRWQLGPRAEAWPSEFPSPFRDRPPPRFSPASTRLSFIGHASYLIQIGGLNILFDPVYADRAGPLGLVGPRRVNAPGIAFDDLPKIDVLLVTHNHYDHLDMSTIGRVWQRDRPIIITALGNDVIMRNGVDGLAATGIDWWQTVDLENGVRVNAVPTQHWSARGLNDRMHALWASFVIEGPRHTLYMVGDSGFGAGATFKSIAKRHAHIDLAALPIGAYEPRWFMSDQHMNPDDAVQSLALCGAARAVGHHWGTFRLTNEGIEAPPNDLARACKAANISPDRFKALRPGEVVTLA